MQTIETTQFSKERWL